jgi:hypothetical protein
LGYVLYRELKVPRDGVPWFAPPECLKAGSKRKHNKMDASKLTGRLYNFLDGER